MEYLYFYFVVIGCGLIFWLLTSIAMKIMDYYSNKKDVIIDKRQNVKIGNTWVTLTNKEPEPIWTDYEMELRNEIDKAYREYLNKAKTLNWIDNEIMNSPFYNDSKIVEYYYNHCEFDVNKNRWIPIKNNEVVHSVTFENGETKYIKLQR